MQITINNEIVIVDIFNTVVNVNDQLTNRGVQIDSYCSVIPTHVWDDEQIFREAAPIYPVVHFVRCLSKVAEIVYLTGSPKEFQKVTVEWLRKYNVPEASIVFTNGWSKGEVVLEMTEHSSKKAIVFEDSPREIESILSVQPNIHLFIPDWLYNRHIKGNRIEIA